eukprot:scaffold460796_cov19-Prasinocladus_malaysianus.AAC.1
MGKNLRLTAVARSAHVRNCPIFVLLWMRIWKRITSTMYDTYGPTQADTQHTLSVQMPGAVRISYSYIFNNANMTFHAAQLPRHKHTQFFCRRKESVR